MTHVQVEVKIGLLLRIFSGLRQRIVYNFHLSLGELDGETMDIFGWKGADGLPVGQFRRDCTAYKVPIKHFLDSTNEFVSERAGEIGLDYGIACL